MSLQNEMERVGRITAADQNLEVRVRGVQAYATRGVVTIPNIETFEWLGRNAYRMLHGLLDHECGHAVDSDFDALVEFKKEGHPAALTLLQNVVEDGYVERLRGRAYIGCGHNLTLMNEWFYKRKDDKGHTFTEHLAAGTGDKWTLFMLALGTVLTPYGRREIEFYKDLNSEIYEMLCACRKDIEEARTIVTTKATDQNIEIAKRIYARFHQEEPESGDEGSKAKSSKPEDRDEDCEVEELPPELMLDLERWTQDLEQPLNATDQINVIIRDVFEKSDREIAPYTNFSHEFDAFRDFSSEDLLKSSEYYDSEMAEAFAASESLVQCFEAALHATEMARPVGGNDEGEIDAVALPEFAVGSLPADQLYVQFAETDADDVAVALLCDCSGSMGGTKQQLCRLVAMAFSHALHQVQIPHEVSGFTTLDSSSVHTHAWSQDKPTEYHDNFEAMKRALDEAASQGTKIENFARELRNWGAYRRMGIQTLFVPFHVRFKSFESEDARGLTRITSIDHNLDGEAVLWQAQRLAERAERRKVLFVLSDGMPAGSRNNEQGARYLKEVIDRVVDAGVEVYGLGIQSDHVRDYYPDWWVCHDLDDLIEVAMSALIEVLTKNRTERDRVFL